MSLQGHQQEAVRAPTSILTTPRYATGSSNDNIWPFTASSSINTDHACVGVVGMCLPSDMAEMHGSQCAPASHATIPRPLRWYVERYIWSMRSCSPSQAVGRFLESNVDFQLETAILLMSTRQDELHETPECQAEHDTLGRRSRSPGFGVQ